MVDLEIAITAGMLGWAAWTDIKKHIIPNAAVGLGILAAIIINHENIPWVLGNLALTMFPVLAMWFLGIIGAGDVKLAGAIGALLGKEPGLEIICFTFIMAMLWVIAASLYNGNLKWVISENIRGLKMFFTGQFKYFIEEHKNHSGLPLGAFFVPGFALWLITAYTGGLL